MAFGGRPRGEFRERGTLGEGPRSGAAGLRSLGAGGQPRPAGSPKPGPSPTPRFFPGVPEGIAVFLRPRPGGGPPVGARGSQHYREGGVYRLRRLG